MVNDNVEPDIKYEKESSFPEYPPPGIEEKKKYAQRSRWCVANDIVEPDIKYEKEIQYPRILPTLYRRKKNVPKKKGNTAAKFQRVCVVLYVY